MIPSTLGAWTLDAIRLLLAQQAFENDRLEWKEQLPRDDHGKRRLRVTLASFANADGGFVVFGVRDDVRLSIGERLVGVPADAEVAHELGQILAGCVPPIVPIAKNPPIVLESGRCVHVVEITASSRRPHGVLTDENWRFPMRAAGGTRTMTWEELRDGFTDVRRRRRLLLLLRSEVTRLRELGESVNRLGANWRYAFVREAVSAFAQSFDSTQVEHAFVELADDLTRDPHLVTELNVARELAKEWDEGARDFARLVRARWPEEAEITARAQLAMRFGSRIHHAATHVLNGVDKLLSAP